MRILVTGGAGFIGSHVVDAYVDAGHQVAVVDNLSTGERKNLNAAATFFELDLRDPSLHEVLTEFRPNVVNHHAAQANVPASVADPVKDASINVLGSLNLLRSSADAGVEKFIYASSGGAMYGEPHAGSIPLSEDTPARPISPYGASKFAVEAWLGVFHRTFGLQFTVLRYANVYGPRQGVRDEGAAVAVFATRMVDSRSITLDGTGAQTRDFIYVGDCATANLAALEHGGGDAFNIATGTEVSIRELFGKLAILAEYPAPPNFGPARVGDISRIALDPGRARSGLNWEAATTLDDGLRATYEYFHDRSN